MIPSPTVAPTPTLDSRWIIALWAAIHGVPADTETPGEKRFDATTVRAAAGRAILALAAELDAEAAQAVTAALAKLPGLPVPLSDAEVEDSLKRLGIRLYEPAAPGQQGMSVAGFGKFCWPDPAA
jgi:hypothetical protein